MPTFGAENEGGIAAVIIAIATLIGAVFTGIYNFLKNYDGRMDKATGESMKQLAARTDDALAGEERMRLERDQARAETVREREEKNKWMERATAAELKLARMRARNDDDT